MTFKVKDIIGVIIKMAPPYKYPNPTKISEGSSLTFYKNGKFIYEYT
jgi:hypothetical protein